MKLHEWLYPLHLPYSVSNILLPVRYGNKHPKMEIRINVDSKGILSPGQRLGVEVSLMPGRKFSTKKLS